MIRFVFGLLLCALQGEPVFAPVEVTSANGMFAAEVHKALGQERVKDALARWRLSVFELPREAKAEPLWSCVYPHRPGERGYVLADDGHAFAALETEFTESRPLVRVWRDAELQAELTADALDIARRELAPAAPKSWLGAGAASTLWLDTQRGPTLFLELKPVDGTPRLIDFETGAVRTSREFTDELVVAPAASLALFPGMRAAAVRSCSVAPIAYWGELLLVDIAGSFPTPNWCLMGFEATLGGEDGRELVLTAWSAPPTANSVQLQVIQNFQYVARVGGLAPGRYRVRCTGALESAREPITVEVKPARALIELHRTRGEPALDTTIRVYAKGVAIETWTQPARDPATRCAVLPTASKARVAELARSACAPMLQSSTYIGDPIVEALILFDGERMQERRGVESERDGARRALIELLLALFE